jgi:hypothetical protein
MAGKKGDGALVAVMLLASAAIVGAAVVVTRRNTGGGGGGSKAGAGVTIYASPTSVIVGQAVVFSGVASSAAGVPVTGAAVTLYQDGSAVEGGGVTGPDGSYALSYVPPVAATYAFEVRAGSVFSPALQVVVGTTGKISSAPPTITISPSDVTSGETWTATVSGLTPEGSAWLLEGGSAFAQLVADDGGDASFVYPDVETVSYLAAGSYSFTVQDAMSGLESAPATLTVAG